MILRANTVDTAGIVATVKNKLSELGRSFATGVSNLMTRRTISGYAEGDIVSNKQLAWVAEEGPEAIIPLNNSLRSFELWKQTGTEGGFFDRHNVDNIGRASDSVSIQYNPTIQFYGDAPSRSDITDALRMSQESFEAMMDEYLKKNRRVALG